jgi:hypothetical protein
LGTKNINKKKSEIFHSFFYSKFTFGAVSAQASLSNKFFFSNQSIHAKKLFGKLLMYTLKL